MMKMTAFARHVLVLVLMTWVAWGLSLGNQFALDDVFLLDQNSFYSSFSNASRIFTKTYSTNPKNFFLTSSQTDRGSGSVAYRPVLTLTYFLDSALWGKNPFGFHLTNLLIHTVNVVLVYVLFVRLFGLLPVSFLAGLLFAVHPVQSEAICAIGFRGDLLVTLWGLLAALSWMGFREGRSWAGVGAGLFYGLALFSKEAAILLPCWFFAFDCWRKVSWIKSLRSYIFLGAVALFYLWLYFFVFPNASLNAMYGLLPDKLSVWGQIWLWYILYFLFPFLVVPFPAHYYPYPRPLSPGSEIFGVVIILVLLGILALRKSSVSRPYHLMWLWGVLFLFPAAGIIPNPNPAGLRYLYFPSVGAYFFLALALWKIAECGLLNQLARNWKKLWLGFFVGICLLGAFFNIGYWKDYFTIGHTFAHHFPDFYGGHVSMGEFYGGRGEFMKAAQEFNIALDDSRNDSPFLIYHAGMSYFYLKDYKKAEQAFEFLLEKAPDYGWGYRGMGLVRYAKGMYAEAVPYLEKSLIIDPTEADVYYLFKTYRLLGEKDKADIFLEKNRNVLSEETFKKLLNKADLEEPDEGGNICNPLPLDG